MATSSADDDLVASKTEGFKVGEKKTVEEYAKLGMSGFYQQSPTGHPTGLWISQCLWIKHSITIMSLLSVMLNWHFQIYCLSLHWRL